MAQIQTPKYRRLLRLRLLLKYELLTVILFFLWFLGDIILLTMTFSAAFFIPFLLIVLISERRVKWLITFFIMIIIPLIVSIFLLNDFSYKLILFYVILILFYIYCFVLKFVIPKWIEERSRIDRGYLPIEKIEF